MIEVPPTEIWNHQTIGAKTWNNSPVPGGSGYGELTMWYIDRLCPSYLWNVRVVPQNAHAHMRG